MKNPFLQEMTEKTIQKEMMLWLRNSRDITRHGGQKWWAEQMMQAWDGIDRYFFK